MISIEEKQSKICELTQLLSQRKNAEQKQSIGIVLTEYETYLLTTPYEQWMRITTMLQDGEIEEDIYEEFLLNPERYVLDMGQIILNEKWEEEAEEKELERIAKLSLTKREVFLGIYRAKGVTPEQIRAGLTDTAAIIEFDYAERYYRGNPLIDIVGETLGITSEQLDLFFEDGNYEHLI